jgi:hypothetical protein
VFFEGVENKISSGVKPEEVGYQLAFSKQELRKVIKEYQNLVVFYYLSKSEICPDTRCGLGWSRL